MCDTLSIILVNGGEVVPPAYDVSHNFFTEYLDNSTDRSKILIDLYLIVIHIFVSVDAIVFFSICIFRIITSYIKSLFLELHFCCT